MSMFLFGLYPVSDTNIDPDVKQYLWINNAMLLTYVKHKQSICHRHNNAV